MNDAKVAGRDGPRRGTLRRLARDPAGNTLAMMAIALIPISALAGSALDTARLYVVKSRLQQACDAGVLAGRKFMSDATATTLDTTATTQARNFFNNNFTPGWMQTTNIAFTPTRTSENRVAGVASVQVPMTVMKMFGAADVTLGTTCEARFDIADTDILFVLDTTGSMACLPADSDTTCSNYAGSATKITYTRPTSTANLTPGYVGTTGYSVTEKSGSRIAALRTAVVDFYDTMAAAKQPTTKVRYGFVPYTSTVNAGASIRAMSASYIVGGNGSGDTAPYETRYVTGEYEISRSATNNSKTQANCGVGFTPVRTPATARTFNTDGRATLTAQEWNSDRYVRSCQDITKTMGPVWTYEQRNLDVSAYVANATATDPTKADSATSAWLGCIEEPDASSSGRDSFDVNNLPPNLNPDLIPTGASRWQPMWPEVEYQRTGVYYSGWSSYRDFATGTITTSGDDNSIAPWMASYTKQTQGNVSCGKPVQRLAELTKAQVQTYVNAVDFSPLGGTYHDVGMLWATRLLSRTGIFASDNAAQDGRGRPKRVIVFLTDGMMSPSPYLYGLHGMEYWDNRVANGDLNSLKAYHNARFLALCNKAKAMDIDVWTVALGLDSTTELTNCATSTDQALDTTSGTGLSDTFKKIAKAVAMLRISK